ncbi:uncharacterized protein PHACADRAFT_265822 [Phanerochaete carnosa HHB-10118-sp]|uniref:Uncharacterized protein n=1 Tax=Phanerochaete carnosa (strain HHB-10118-sp) TaxID=650164 RepID=K5VDB1_PHACS|nr:uncharacterized protein PHACADRAFT_265822 [Phanerochaete carnosa HHB-10118-sp]EKM49123.1 hypothetical protein PHACADRAFT_265822 [Phanerochaete carnosa HHB-10118-sp]
MACPKITATCSLCLTSRLRTSHLLCIPRLNTRVQGHTFTWYRLMLFFTAKVALSWIDDISNSCTPRLPAKRSMLSLDIPSLRLSAAAIPTKMMVADLGLESGRVLAIGTR